MQYKMQEYRQKSPRIVFIENTMGIAKRIKQARKIAGYRSQEEFAPVLGVIRSTLGKYESKDETVSLDVVKGVSEHTGQPLAWFFLEDGQRIIGEGEDKPTPRQALDVLTELVETAEAQERQLSQFRAVVRELAGEDPESWSDAVKAVMGGGTHPSPHSARSGEVKSSEVGNRFHGRRRGREDRAESDTAGQNP